MLEISWVSSIDYFQRSGNYEILGGNSGSEKKVFNLGDSMNKKWLALVCAALLTTLSIKPHRINQENERCASEIKEEIEESVDQQIGQAKDWLKKEIAFQIGCLKTQLARSGCKTKIVTVCQKPPEPAPEIINLENQPQQINDKSFKGTDGLLSKTFVIDKPGNYQLVQDIVFDPQTPGTPAILIQSNNVTVDLNGRVLSQREEKGVPDFAKETSKKLFTKNKYKIRKHASLEMSSNDAQGMNQDETFPVAQCIGIVVEAGSQNINIVGSHGIIEKFTQLGIQVKGGSHDVQLGGSQLTVRYCGGGTNKPYTNGDLSHYYYEGGIQIGETHFLNMQKFPGQNGEIKGLTINNVQVDENTIGMWLGNVSNGFIKDSSFSFNKEMRSTANRIFGLDVDVFCAGVVSLASKKLGDTGLCNLQFVGCRFNGNEASTKETGMHAGCRGLLINNIHKSLILKNCSFNGNLTYSLNGLASDVKGCLIGGGEGTLIEGCEFSGNCGGTVAIGFIQEGKLYSSKENFTLNPGRSLIIRQCVSANNLVTGTRGIRFGGLRQAFGFFLDFPNGVSMVECTAQNNAAIVEEKMQYTEGRAAGLICACKMDLDGVMYKAANIDIKGFHASGQYTNCYSEGSICAGIFMAFAPGMENISIHDSVITSNYYPDIAAPSRNEVGIFLRGDVPPKKEQPLVSVENCTISNHRSSGIHISNFCKTVVLNNTISQNKIGVLLQSSPLCSILKNTFLYNDQMAVVDTSRISTSLIAQNNAFSPGTSSYDVSYLAPHGSIPVRQGSLTTSFPQGAQVCDNIEMKQPTLPNMELETSVERETKPVAGGDLAYHGITYLEERENVETTSTQTKKITPTVTNSFASTAVFDTISVSNVSESRPSSIPTTDKELDQNVPAAGIAQAIMPLKSLDNETGTEVKEPTDSPGAMESQDPLQDSGNDECEGFFAPVCRMLKNIVSSVFAWL